MNLNIDLICDNDQLRNALMTNYKTFYEYRITQSHMINTTNDKIEEAYKYILMCNIVNNKSPIIYSRHQLAQHPMCKLVQE